MRCKTLILLLPLFAIAPAQAQPYPPGGAPPPPPHGHPPPASGPVGAGENCGTPDDPKPCPPLPRHPLQYYPANRS